MMILYEGIVAIFGDNKKSKRIYKITKMMFVSFIFIWMIINLIVTGISIIDSLKTISIVIYCLFITIIVVIWILICIKMNKNKMESIHTFPLKKGIDLKGGKLKVMEPNGEKILIINCCNGYTIELIYKNNEYDIIIKNDEWDVVKQMNAKTNDDVREALVEAIDFVAEYSKLPDDVPKDKQ